MKNFKYLKNVATLKLHPEKCIGCGMCEIVCPHRVFKINGRKAKILDKDLCMECGACTKNCPVEAISVNPGVGCASYIIKRWFVGDKAECGCSKGS